MRQAKAKVFTSFFVIIATLLMFTASLTMMHVNEANARVLIKDPDCSTIDAKSAGECKINTNNFLDDCSSTSTANCNIAVDINRGIFNPSGDNELKLNYYLQSGIACNSGPGGWTKAMCLMNSVNNYNYNPATGTQTPSINIVTDNRHELMDLEVKYDGSQKVTNTLGKDRFTANNDMKQQVNVRSNGIGSGVDLEGSGADGLQLYFDQLISGPDNSINKNLGLQQFDVAANSGGNIEFLHDQYGYDLQQNIINTNGPTGTTGQLNTLNQGKQILNAKVFNDADVGYDTYGLSTLSQKIQDISGIGTIQNLAGNNNNPGSPINPTSPVLATDTDGMRVNLEASGFGSNVDADNTLQNLDQQIVGFTGSTTSASATNTVNSMLFSALARQVQSNDIADITNTENEPQTQTVNQYIGNSGGNVDLDNIATARINLGFEAFNANPTAGDIPIRGDLKYEDLSQTLNQAITNVNSPTTAKTAFNQGQTLITLLSSNGPSQFIVDGFNQYLDQTVDGCTNCGNIGTVQAIFSVNDAATFTLEEGSIQGLTQYVNQDNVFNNNQVLATIGVTGDGTDASILYQQEVSSINGDNSGPTNNNGISQFSANINSDAQLHCSITDTGNYFAAGYPTSAPTPRSNACT